MRKLAAFISMVALVGVLGCKKDKSPQTPSTPSGDFELTDSTAMWKLVPKQAQLAVVAGPKAPAILWSSWRRVLTDFAKAPRGSELVAELSAEAPFLTDFGEPYTATRFGIDPEKGLAFYLLDEKRPVLLFPITNPSALANEMPSAKVDGYDIYEGGWPCKMKEGYYVCALSREDIETVGVDGGVSPPPVELRGHLEMIVTQPGMDMLRRAGIDPAEAISVRGAVVLEPGGFSAKLSVDGRWPVNFGVEGPSPLLRNVAEKRPSGLLSLRLGPVLDLFQTRLPPNLLDNPLGIGVTARTILEAVTGDIAAYVLAGKPGGVISIGLKDPAPFRQLLGLCGVVQLPPELGRMKLENGRCNFNLTLPDQPSFGGSAWVDDDAIRVGIEDFASARPDAPALSRSAQAIISGEHIHASWGYSSMLSFDLATMARSADLSEALADPNVQLAVWAFFHLTEMGVHLDMDDTSATAGLRVRTTWADPPKVTDQLEAILAKLSRGDFAAQAGVKAIADAHPSSHLSSDLKSGYGLSTAMAVPGILAAVAIPAFLKYIKKSKTSEARQFVKKLSDGARAYYMDGTVGSSGVPASFPKKSTVLTPPKGACCAGSNDKCNPEASLWNDPTWQGLQFSVDAPHYYSYQYIATAAGQAYTVRAVGDLDCDGVYSTFEMYGRVEDGVPVTGENIYRENELE